MLIEFHYTVLHYKKDRETQLHKILLFFFLDFDPSTLHHFWKSMHTQFGNIFKFQIPTLPEFVALVDPNDIEKMYRTTGKNPVRDGLKSFEKVRQEVFADAKGILNE